MCMYMHVCWLLVQEAVHFRWQLTPTNNSSWSHCREASQLSTVQLSLHHHQPPAFTRYLLNKRGCIRYLSLEMSWRCEFKLSKKTSLSGGCSQPIYLYDYGLTSHRQNFIRVKEGIMLSSNQQIASIYNVASSQSHCIRSAKVVTKLVWGSWEKYCCAVTKRQRQTFN